MLTKLDADFKSEWEVFFNHSAILTEKALVQDLSGNYVLAAEYVFDSPTVLYKSVAIGKFDSRGTALWSYTSKSVAKIGKGSLVASPNETGYVLAGYRNSQNQDYESTVIKLTSEGQFDWSRLLSDFMLNSIVRAAADDGYIVFGGLISGSTSQGAMIRLDLAGEVQWTRSLNSRMSSTILLGGQNAFMRYFVVARIFSTTMTEKDSDVILKLGADSNASWKRITQIEGVLTDLKQVTEFEYVALHMGNFQRLFTKLEFSPTSEFPACVDQCYGCGIGYFWNFTRCSQCSFGCVECIDDSTCVKCSRRFVRTTDGRCERIPVCDCSARDLSRECMKNCTLPQCSAEQSTRHTLSGKRVCNCTADRMLDNGTHCLKTAGDGCSALCARCVDLTGACVSCRDDPRVAPIPINKQYMECVCAQNFTLNGSECVLATSRRRSGARNAEREVSLGGLIFGIIGSLLAVIVVVWAIYKKYTSWYSVDSVTIVSLAQNPTTSAAVRRASTDLQMSALNSAS